MITRGSKFFYGAAVVAFLSALFYGFITGASQHGGVFAVFTDGNVVDSVLGPLTLGWKGWVGEHVGYSVLLGAAAVLAGLGGFATAFRDGDAEATAQISRTAHVPPVLRPLGLSFWPLVAAFGAGLVIVGLAVDPVFFVVGLVVLVVAGFSWTVRAWAERATGDQATNRELRHELMDPLEIPVGAVLVGGVVILCVSRLLLAIPKVSATFVIIAVAILVFGAALWLAGRPQIKRSVVVGVLVLGGLLLLGIGIAGGIAGQREFEKHGTEESLAGDSVSVGAGVLNGATGAGSGS